MEAKPTPKCSKNPYPYFVVGLYIYMQVYIYEEQQHCLPNFNADETEIIKILLRNVL